MYGHAFNIFILCGHTINIYSFMTPEGEVTMCELKTENREKKLLFLILT